MQEKIVVMGIFIICAQAVIHFSPGNVYAKYLRLLLSMMVLIQLLQPVLAATLGGNDSMQDFSYGLWERVGSQWTRDWKSVAGYEEQIDAIWEQEIGDYAREYLAVAEEESKEACGPDEESEEGDTQESEQMVIRVKAVEKIRIGE